MVEDVHPHGGEPPGAGHEHSDVNVRGILWFAAGLVVCALAVFLGLGWMFSMLAERENRLKASQYPLAQQERGPARGFGLLRSAPTSGSSGVACRSRARARRAPAHACWEAPQPLPL